MRYQSLTAQTTARCEACGRRVTEDTLFYPGPEHQRQLQGGNAYHFIVQQGRGVEVVVDAAYQTVCSKKCYEQALPESLQRIVAEIQRVSFDAKGLPGTVHTQLGQDVR